METRIDWMKTGRDYWDGQEEKIKAIISKVSWQEVNEGVLLPMIPGDLISMIIRDLKIPGVSHVCISHDMSPFGLIGIRARYSDASVDFFVLDVGDTSVPVCAVVTPIQ